MVYVENDNEKNINSVLAIVKLGVLFFGTIIMLYGIISQKHFDITMNYSLNVYISVVIMFPFMLTIYILWYYLYLKAAHNKHRRNILIVENYTFMLFFSIIIIFTNSYQSDFKYLFLFIIISSVIQLGSKFGITTALLSSLIILSIDLIFAPSETVNTNFQNDLVLATALVLVSWALGKYVDLQAENIDKKNVQLKLLNVKLTEEELQRKYIESMLLKNENCYNLLINNSNNAILIHRDEKLLFANESAAILIGLTPQALVNKSILDFLSFDEMDILKNTYKNIYNSESSTISFEQKFIGVNGITSVVLNTSTSFIYEGKPTILTILHDITSEKQVEILQQDVEKNIQLLNETREFNRFITEFFSNISHELKTPLNIIFSTVQLFELYHKNNDSLAIQNRDKYLSIMKQNCYRLMRLINNLLDMTRVDSGFLVPHMKNYNIISVIEDITMSIITFADTKGVSVVFDTDCEEKVMAFDPDKLERIVLNLLSNALKFTEPGGQISVNIFDRTEYLIISVKDTGIGIPKDKYQLIFQRFRQVDKTLSRNHEGSGIGLSLVKTFVEMHQGTIEVISELGNGSEFIIKLPITLCDENYGKERFTDDNIIERINIEFSDIYS